MADGDDTGARDREEVQRERRATFRLWRRQMQRLAGRRITNADIAALTGLSASSISKKWNGRVPISPRLPLELDNIDRVIALGGFPSNCPEWLRRAIIDHRARAARPVNRRLGV